MESRARLVSSAAELLWERGYVGTSPRAIQHLAEVGQGSMYHHFTGKHALAIDAINVLADDVRQRAQAALHGPGTAIQRIVGYLQMQRDPLKGCPAGRLAHDPDVATDSELRRPVDAYLSWLAGELAGLISTAQYDGDVLPSLDPDAVAASLIATVQGSYVLARASGDPDTQAHAIDGAISLLTREDA